MLCGLTYVSSEQAIVIITSIIIITVTISILITTAVHHLLGARHITWPLKWPEKQKKKMDLRRRGRKAAEEEEEEVDNYNAVQPKTSNGEG